MKRPELNPLTIARMLIILHIVTLTVSTAVASISEVLLYLAFIGFPPLRKRTRTALRQPMVLMTLVIWAMVGIGTLYTAAPFTDALDEWVSWRKCLLLPMAAAVFDDPVWKKKFLWTFIGLMTLAAMISYAEHLFGVSLISKYPIGIIIANHATQSMFFAAASFAGLTLLIFTKNRYRYILWIISALITFNLLFITWGRSGYLAFTVFMMLLSLWKTRGRLRLLLITAIPVSVVLVLMLSPVAKETIEKAVMKYRPINQIRR